jgi:hypothetical protein
MADDEELVFLGKVAGEGAGAGAWAGAGTEAEAGAGAASVPFISSGGSFALLRSLPLTQSQPSGRLAIAQVCSLTK